jgi:hypothetical protein
MALEFEPGWIPHRVRYIDNEPFVEFLTLHDNSLSKPVAYMDMANFKTESLVPLNQFETKDRDPTGFIFHMSRCGSTMTSNVLKACEECVVFSEPYILADILMPPCRVDSAVTAARLRLVVDLHGQAFPDKKIIVKWLSWLSTKIDIIQASFPHTPSIFLMRDPVEVIVSVLKDHPGWMKLIRLSAEIDAKAPEKGTPEFCSLVLRQFCKSIYEAPMPVRAIDYAALPEAIWNDICPYFGIEVDGGTRQSMIERSRFDIRDDRLKTFFVPDSEQKQAEASDRIRELAEKYVAPALDRVQQRGG